MNFLTWIKLLPVILKAAVSVAIALEEVIPEDGWGNEKLAALDEFMRDAIDAAEDISVDYKIIQPRVHKIVEVVVSLLNKTGKFRAG